MGAIADRHPFWARTAGQQNDSRQERYAEPMSAQRHGGPFAHGTTVSDPMC